MPKLEFTQQEINQFANKTYEHYYKKRTVEDCKELEVHADGCKPELLLCQRRPNEPLEVMEYRLCIWEPITQEPISKVFSSLQKIRRSPDWVIKYPDQEEFTLIADGASLEDYCEKNFPYFKSITNWLFALYLKKSLVDANTVVLIIPLEQNDKNDQLQPFPMLYRSCDVIDIVEEDYAVLESPTGCKYYKENQMYEGRRFYVVTTMQILRYDQTNEKGEFSLENVYDHNLEFLPAFKVPSQLKDVCEGRMYNVSRIDGMVCHLNEAAREYSDLQAAKVNHMYPERWEYTQNACTDCSGTGRRTNPVWLANHDCGCPEQIDCTTCLGRGFKVAGPYAKILLRPSNTALENSNTVPTPPAGYIEKDVEIIKVQEASVDAHIFKALSAVNMEFLAQVPLAQSGTAKEVDRDESRNTVHSVAEDIVAAADRIYYTIAKYRYGHLYGDEMIRTMLPNIPVPERFDLVSSAQALQEVKLAKDSKANPLVINAMEIDFCSKKFSTEPDIADQLILELELDPLPNITEDDKMSRLSNKGITQETYVVSSNIHAFVAQAMEEENDFAAWDRTKQLELMEQYAEDIIKENSSEQQIIGSAEPIDGNIPGDQQSNQQVQQDASGQPAGNAQGGASGTQAA